MHIRSSTFGLVVLIFVTLSHAFVDPTCTKMKDALKENPDKIFHHFQELVCDKGKYKPKVSNYEKWADKNAVQPMIKKVMKDMGLPDKESILQKLAKQVVKVVKTKCKKYVTVNLCQDPETLEGFGACLKDNLLPVVMENIGGLMPLVSEPMCKKEFAYLQKDELWDKVIPSYMFKYAAVCKKLNYEAKGTVISTATQ
ncbi:hypothetical protein N7532_003604 [Penicillium argentinense]|uniref:Uncharacterized protein n=1 Tax=Penicillium argentinense TaxID=1131581 RepID=A0A9W9FMR2_9EURO|nr:uncharacterized protein N7532_003604 [Penicillium argentinense]KAJ5103075.1 hypothetical protein N7532_003604 [Penicillium argentinense]